MLRHAFFHCAHLVAGAGLMLYTLTTHAIDVAPWVAQQHAVDARAFANTSRLLVPALATHCRGAKPGLGEARNAWIETMVRWETYTALAIGPVLERRVQRQLDFSPTRPAMIAKAIRKRPATPAAMERIGTPAKGLPALEWLLWVEPVAPQSPACDYAVQVAEELAREADTLAQLPFAYPQSLEARNALLGEFINQWVAGLERLRWAQMEMPARVAQTSGLDQPDYPRAASGASVQSWGAQWASLHRIGIWMHTQLQQAGHMRAAETLATALATANQAMQGLRVDAHGFRQVIDAALAVGAVKVSVESVVAPALGVSIGFSDADGD